MNGVYLFLLAACLGFLAAIPVGASQIEVAKRAIHGHLSAAWAVVLGSVSSDIMYGIVALFGIAPLLEVRWIMAVFMAVGAVFLWFLSFRTFKESRRPHEVRLESPSLKSLRWGYATGFSLAVTNPPMILSWLWGVALAKHLGLASPFSISLKATFIAGGALGLGGYLSSLAVVMHRIKHFFSAASLAKIYYWLGILLFLLSFYFVFNALKHFLGPS